MQSVANRNGTADSLIFPIVFLYRQYIELRLKSLLLEGSQLLDKIKEIEGAMAFILEGAAAAISEF